LDGTSLARLHEAGPEQLRRIAARVLDAPDLASVFSD
jgi:hypothetical protein